MTTLRSHSFQTTPVTAFQVATELREDSPTLAEAQRTAETWLAIANRDADGTPGVTEARALWADVATLLRLETQDDESGCE